MGSAIKEGIVTKEMVELCGMQIRLTTPTTYTQDLRAPETHQNGA